MPGKAAVLCTQSVQRILVSSNNGHIDYCGKVKQALKVLTFSLSMYKYFNIIV
jgi:hypothetical protein